MNESSVSDLPVWTGKSADPMQWDNYRYAVQGYCASRGLSALLRPGHTSPTDQGDRELKERLMGRILLQTTRDLAGVVVRPFADGGGGVRAWRALIARYGNDNLELRQEKQIEYMQKIFETRYTERGGILDMIHTLEHLFTEMDKLDCMLPESFKRNVVLLQLRSGVAPEIYTALAMETNMKFQKTSGEVKKLAALNSAVDEAKRGKDGNVSIFYGTNKPTKVNGKKKWKILPKQCFWCLEFGHMVQTSAFFSLNL